MKKMAIVTTHAIQYNAPWFKQLAKSNLIQLKVFYTWSQTQEKVKDKNFGKEIKWDIPLLEGYDYEFVENVSKQPGSHHFKGIDNPNLITKMKAFSPDVVLVFGWKLKSHMQVMKFFKGKIPVWFRGDSTLIDEKVGLKSLLRSLVLRNVYRYIDKALYVGSANKAYFLNYGLTEKELIYAPHAVDNQRFMGTPEDAFEEQAQNRRTAYGFEKEDIVVVYAGKFEPKKQPDFLLHAIIKANEHRKRPLKLLMVGQGTLENNLKKIASENNCIKFVPFINQKEMPIVYRVGDVFCLPSKGPGETWGLAVNEAIASGRPVIVSDKVGCARDVVNAEVGWVVKHNSMEDLILLFQNLDSTSLKNKSKGLQEKIDFFSYDSIVKAIENNLQ